MILPDVNLLVYAYNSDVPHHLKAKLWWQDLVRSGQSIGICWPVLQGLLRILTNRKILPTPYLPEEVFGVFHSWWEQPNMELLAPSSGTYQILQRLCVQGQVTAALTTDALIAAFALEHKGRLATNDTDFQRFEGLRILNPLQ